MNKSIFISGITIFLIVIKPFFGFSQNVGTSTIDENKIAIPDINQQAIMRNGQVILATTLKVGDQVKLIFPNKEEIVTVREVNENSFAVSSHYSGKIFVFGRVVNRIAHDNNQRILILNISDSAKCIAPKRKTIR